MNLKHLLTDKRKERLKGVVSRRQFDLAVVLENIHDAHNISAVMRSCDAVGIFEIYAVVTDPRIDLEKYEVHNKISSGSGKWVQIHVFHDVKSCVLELRKKFDKLLGTHLSEDSKSLYEIDFSHSSALVFGNEHAGLSEEFLKELDGNFIIPQFGMVQSLNISVACAVSVFEAARQKIELGQYIDNPWEDHHQELYDHYVLKSKPRLTENSDE